MRLYNTTDVGRLLGISHQKITYHIKMAHLEPSSVQCGRTRLFTEDDVERVRTFFNLKTAGTRQAAGGFYTISQAARTLGVSVHLLSCRVKRGTVTGPIIKKGQRLYYDEDALKVVAEQLAGTNLFMPLEAAHWLGMPLVTLYTWMRESKVPRPTHRAKRTLCWTRDELRQIKKQHRGYFIKKIKLV